MAKALVSTVASIAALRIATPRQMRAAAEYESKRGCLITARSIPLEEGGSATGVLITDKSH